MKLKLYKNDAVKIEFQLLLKGCTIEADFKAKLENDDELFQLLLKGCTIEATISLSFSIRQPSFSCC